jgi:Ser/Thr protein kinase RdoA (MazF antagonist)
MRRILDFPFRNNMSSAHLDHAARSVLQRYCQAAPNATLRRLAQHGGFSGARLWQVSGGGITAVLKAWPSTEVDAGRLVRIHHLMHAARLAGLDFVPAVYVDDRGRTVVDQAERLWDLAEWRFGEGFCAAPSTRRVENACACLARLHAAWASPGAIVGPCPAVQRRLARLHEWKKLVSGGWRPAVDAVHGAVQAPIEGAWRTVNLWFDSAAQMLMPWVDRLFPLQPCLCDIWHDHVLFQGETVTGIIDYGSAKVDHVAVDLARLLGTTVQDDATLRAAGLEAYGPVRALSFEEQELVTVLDKTGIIVGLANWVRWLYLDRRPFEDYSMVAQRIQKLLARVERWP